ncbi:MAG: Ig-like domain-containing protein [Ignavibacteriales bacterium]|nr:Ig-like domain-containing protein [Ignavibacteriales bacterium]
MMKKILLLTLLLISQLSAQTTNIPASYFSVAAAKYNIPEEILLAIAGSQTHFTNIVPFPEQDNKLHQPPVYGIMALRDDAWFGHSLRQAANLINQPVSVVKNNLYYNILGAAAYLAQLAEKAKIDKSSIPDWKPVLENYSGIPQESLREFYSFEVLQCYRQGLAFNEVVLAPHPDFDMKVFRPDVRGESGLGSIESTDYPAAVWDPSPNFTTNSITQSLAVVHTTEGGFAGSLSWLKNPDAQASSHYIIRSSDGYMVQLVRESNKAWHARCWNGYMLGVEHEAYVAVASYYTDAMYISSAALFRHFAQKFSIPMTRNRIIGHNEWQGTTWKTWMAANFPAIDVTCNTHSDPGVYWDWPFYMQLVSQDTTRPAIITHTPAVTDTVSRNTTITLTFNQKMKKNETQAAFSIAPAVAGTFTWADNQRTLVFTPSTSLPGGTTYLVTIGSAAKNYLALSPSVPYTFSFSTLSQLAITSAYPANNSTGLHFLPQITIAFNALVKPSTIAANVLLQKSDNSIVPTSTISYGAANGLGSITFSPTQPLNEYTSYKVTIKSTLLDTSGFSYGANSIYSFTTGQNLFINGSIFDALEVIGGWKDPNYSGSTVGTDTSSSFSISTDKVKAGQSAGKLKYLFTGTSGGICREYNSNKPNQGSLIHSRTGFWIFGDLSYNFLEYWFYYNTSTNVMVRVDTLNWLGWKFVEMPLALIPQPGDKLFHSIVIRQNPAGRKDGTIYIDDAQRTETSKFSIKCQPEGMYNLLTNSWGKDTLVFALHDIVTPYNIIEQQKVLPDTSGNSTVLFTKAVMGSSYYMTVNHRNSVEIWSKASRLIHVPVQSFDFLTTKQNVLGDNLAQIGGRMCMYSGDVNQDGYIDFTDMTLIDNDAYIFTSGFVVTDLNSDEYVDFTDLTLCDNNAYNFIGTIKPGVSKNELLPE